MGPSTASAILFPKVLLGTRSGTRRAWGKIARKAARQGSWDEVFESLEYVSVQEHREDILLCDDNSPCGRSVWHMHWVGGYWGADGVPAFDAATVNDLTLSGMGHFWFTVGLLSYHHLPERPSGWFYQKTVWLRKEMVWFRQELRNLVSWLPEILLLQERFRSGLPIGPTGFYLFPAGGLTLWQSAIYRVARQAFPEAFLDDPDWEEHYRLQASFDPQSREGFFMQTGKQMGIDYEPTNIVEILLERKIIERDADRFRMCHGLGDS